jgi:hypothetical protein
MIQIFGLKSLSNVVSLNNVPTLGRENIAKRKICTDLIFFSLAVTSENFLACLKRNLQLLDFSKIGSFSPDDMKTLGEVDTYFTRVNPSSDNEQSQKKMKQKIISTKMAENSGDNITE